MNSAYSSARNHRGRFLVGNAEAYMNRVGYETRRVFRGAAIKDKGYVALLFHFTDKRKRDAANYGKLFIDSLTKILWEDDDNLRIVTDKCQPCQCGKGDFIEFDFTTNVLEWFIALHAWKN